MKKLLLNLLMLSIPLLASTNNLGSTPMLLTKSGPHPWGYDSIAINDRVIGRGTSPSFSYGKDRVAYIDSANILLYDGFKTDTLIKMGYYTSNITVSWDTLGRIYYPQKLSLVRLDTGTRMIDTVYTFKHAIMDSVNKANDTVYNWELCEGNIISEDEFAFTLRGEFNRSVSIDKRYNVVYVRRAFTCQTAMSYHYGSSYLVYTDNRHVNITFADNLYMNGDHGPYCCIFYYVSNKENSSYNRSIWTIRFFKHDHKFMSSFSFKENYSTLYRDNRIIDSIPGRVLFDYIPHDGISSTENRIKSPTSPFSGVVKTYDIRGRQVFNPRLPGVYFEKRGMKVRKFVIK